MNSQIDPQTFSLSAVIIGVLLSNDYSAAELNAIGNWLMLIGQYLETYSAQKTIVQSNIQNRINNNMHKEIINNYLSIKKNIINLYKEIENIKDRGEL